jgi:hypothetical protein
MPQKCRFFVFCVLTAFAPVLLAEEPVAETVPLPAERPAAATTTDDADAPILATETPLVEAGGKALFSLYGPETLLRGALARYVVRDEFGRQLRTATIKINDLAYSEGKPRQIEIPVEHPIGRQHALDLSIAMPDGKPLILTARFSVQPAQEASHGWENWITLTSSPPLNGNWEELRALGISGGIQYRLHPARHEALKKGQALFYVENVSRQMLSRYQTEPGLWEKTIAAMSVPDSPRTAFAREPSLCSHEFAETLARELKRHGESYAHESPIFYSMASEPSMTRLSAAADFDFSAPALADFQRWLEREVYGTLPTLNTEWGTSFKAWTDVIPMTTDEARLRLADNVMSFAPWADFREFQDHTFAKVLREGGDFLRQSDPSARIAITGAMGAFAFGGWDWSRLSGALDCVECYDIGHARELWRDLAPGKPALAMLPVCATGSAALPVQAGETADAIRTLWHLALEGGPRGTVLWEETNEKGEPAGNGVLGPNGKPSEFMLALEPTLKTLGGETGALLAHSRKSDDGIAILYSPASIRVTWLLEADHLHGNKWLEAWGKDTSGERRESPQLRLRESWCRLLDDLGLSWRFISSAQVEAKEILKPESGIKTLVLTRCLALSDREADAIRQFVQQGGKVVADCCCGRFDEHGRARQKPALDDIFGIDTSAEPFIAESMNPLESVKAPKEWGTDALKALAPVFSDKAKRVAQLPCAEYRGSPVLASNKGSAYLNLDLTDYLRWRLHPDRPIAQTTRDWILRLGFADRRESSPIDWSKSQLPYGTRVIWLTLGEGSSGERILALMRNPQTRLHELGAEADGNWAFEKAEPFTLQFRNPISLNRLFPANSGEPTRQGTKIEGTLDPLAPVLFAISAGQGKGGEPAITLSPTAKAGVVVDIKVAAPSAAPRVYGLKVTGPDGKERPFYGGTFFSKTGASTRQWPTALNDASGTWIITVRDVLSGVEASKTIELLAPDAKP